MDEISFDTFNGPGIAQMTELTQAEYQALRATIRERGTARLWAVLAGLIAWGAVGVALQIARPNQAAWLFPLVVLAGTCELNFFIHTGVERIGRYIQVFYEETAGIPGWETTTMNYGAKFPSGLDPLFTLIFSAALSLNLLAAFTAEPTDIWPVSLLAHLAFAYRIVSVRKLAASQRALDLERFRAMLSK